MSNCTPYSHKIREYIIPPLNIFKPFCTPTDKANMFLVALMRTIIWFSIYKITTPYISKKGPWIYVRNGLYGIFIANIIFLIITTLHNVEIIIEIKPSSEILDIKHDLISE